MRDETDVPTRQLNDRPVEPVAQGKGRVMARVAGAVTSDRGEDAFSGKGFELRSWVLTQLVLEPVCCVGLVAWGACHHRPIGGGEGAFAERRQGGLGADLAVPVVQFGEEVEPSRSVGQ